MILVDTSVWIDHLRTSIALLREALEAEEVLVHPFIIGELACGEMKQRSEVLGLLATLPSSVVATNEETLHFIERHRLMGKGIGYIDAHLLASVTLTDGAQLWTRDKRLAGIAAELKIRSAGA
ncbi:MAG TPA: type II toxin-antitoxin system VapC family toxin [Thermoanaerobaculia bacterium]|nr:type II toxin-antitoxin system VapC family toxin [Thermoanaerobaculia bacterium]